MISTLSISSLRRSLSAGKNERTATALPLQTKAQNFSAKVEPIETTLGSITNTSANSTEPTHKKTIPYLPKRQPWDRIEGIVVRIWLICSCYSVTLCLSQLCHTTLQHFITIPIIPLPLWTWK